MEAGRPRPVRTGERPVLQCLVQAESSGLIRGRIVILSDRVEFLTMRPTFTIGIEEEYQTVDPITRDLRSHIHTEMMEQGRMRLQERVKAEMHQAVVEVGTSVCTRH